MHVPFSVYVMLFAAVCLESLGVSFLEKSKGMTIGTPVVISLFLLSVSFVLGGLVVKSLPVGIYYAMWSGVGIVLSGVLGYFINKQSLDAPALLGMGLIIVGVFVIYMYSKSGVS